MGHAARGIIAGWMAYQDHTLGSETARSAHSSLSHTLDVSVP
jgi:hypothetical protein